LRDLLGIDDDGIVEEPHANGKYDEERDEASPS
jgi:hypothetical protein